MKFLSLAFLTVPVLPVFRPSTLSPPTTHRPPLWRCATGRSLTLGSSDGAKISAWLAEPSPDDQPSYAHGILLLSDILGHNNRKTQSFAIALAEAGFSVLIPDLFRGAPWDPSCAKAEYETWRSGHPHERVAEDIRGAAGALKELCSGEMGIVGFCFGGGRGMDEIALGAKGLDPGAAVVFYPTRFDAVAAGRGARCALKAVFGEKDELVPMQVVEDLQAGIEENNVIEDVEVAVYEGAGHAFAHHPKSEQDEDDSEILKFETVEWFKEHLAGESD